MVQLRKSDLISVVLPVYNGERFLRESIESILEQTYENFELIIVDDCSTDGTTQIIENYAKKDSRIRIIKNQFNIKLPMSLNVGFSMARGKYYTWTSDDNKYKKNALEIMYREMEKHPEYGLIYSDMEYINEFGENIGVLHSSSQEVYQYNCIGACFLYKSECKEKIGDYDVERFLVEDYDYWLRISQNYEVAHFDGILYQYRYHEKSLTMRRTIDVGIQLLKLKKEYFPYLINKMVGEEKKAFIFEMIIYGADAGFFEKNMASEFCEDWFFRKRKYIDKRKVMLFGAGTWGVNALEYLGKENVIAFVDNNPDKIGKKIKKKKVISLYDLKENYKDYNIVISTDVRKAYYIAQQLEENKITNYILFYEIYGRKKDGGY